MALGGGAPVGNRRGSSRGESARVGQGASGRGIGQRTGPFRPFRPFGESERNLFFGRDPELSVLGELFAADRPTVLVTGESGIGKTSFLRAAVIPYFSGRGVSCLYMGGERLIDDVPTPSPSGGLLVLDDLGTALADIGRVELLVSVLRRVAQQPTIKVVFAIDDQQMHRLDPFEQLVGSIGPVGARLRLEGFDEVRTGDVIERTVLGGGAYFESGLSRIIAEDLCGRGLVSPTAIQVVAGTAVAQQLTTMRAYAKAGGAEALVFAYLQTAIHEAGGTGAARVLGELAAKDASRSLEELAFVAGRDVAAVQRVIGSLEAAGLAASVDGAYRLASEWLRAPVLAVTGPVRGAQVSSRLELRRALAGSGFVGPATIHRVRRDAGGLRPDEARLVARSMRLSGVVALGALGLGIALVGGSYLRAAHSHYFDNDGYGPGAPVVVRLGKLDSVVTRLPHLPRFHSVVTDTGFAAASLRGPLPEGALRGNWTDELAPALRPLPRAMLGLLSTGDGSRLGEVFEDPASRTAVLDVLAAAGTGTPTEVQLVKRGLDDEAEAVRRHAVTAAVALESRKPGATGSLLAHAWKDPSGAVRALVVSEVARLPDQQAVPLFVDALAEDPVTRKAALDAIAARIERTPAAAAALGRALGGPAGKEAGALVQRTLLAGGPGADALSAVLARVALDGTAPEDSRLEAMRLLRQTPKPPEGLEAVSGSQRLAAAALPLLARKSPDAAAAKLGEAMKGPPMLRAGAAAAIGVLPRTADTPKLLKQLSYDPSADVRAEASRAQVALGRDALPLLVRDAKQGGPDVEKAAVETIGAFAGKLGWQSAISALEQAAKGPRPATRKAAIEQLGRLAGDKPGPVAAALARLSREKNPQIRADAASGLGDVLERGAKEAVVALRAQGKDPDPQTRRKAAEALGRAKGPLQPLAAKALASLVDDAEPTVRAEVASSLGELGTGAQAEGGALVTLLGDKDPSVRAAARRAAQVLGPNAARAGAFDKVLLASLPQASVTDRMEIAVTAGRTGSVATARAALADVDAGVRRAAAENATGTALLPALVGALGDRDAAVRVAAVRGLVGAKAVSQLARAARSTEIEVRIAALEALGEVGGAEARKVLEDALGEAEERVRIAAAHGLGKAGPDAAPALERALHDPVRGVREAAARGLGYAWQARPLEELARAMQTDDDADVRWAGAFAMARRGGGAEAAAVSSRLDALMSVGTPAQKLTARVTRAYLGHADEMAELVRVLRDGG
ncbi:MAG: HEAT repeat domain-containing protein [Polyangia bacterium]